MKKRVSILVLLCCIISLFAVGCEKNEKIVWDELVLGNQIPEITNKEGTNFHNSNGLLILYIENVSAKEYYQYIEKVKERGFTIDIEKDDFNFRAFNEEGYELKLGYFDYHKELEIELEDPEEYEEFEWPDTEMTKKIPETNSKTGEIIESKDDRFYAEISNITKEELDQYINSCKDKGFNKNIDTEDYTYYAENEEGYRLSIIYKGFNIISIKVEEPVYEVKITVTSNKNRFLNKYDVDIVIDDEYYDSIENGKTNTFTVYLTKGKHHIVFEKETNYEVNGSTDFTIDGEDELKYEITCATTNIKVEDKYEELNK